MPDTQEEAVDTVTGAAETAGTVVTAAGDAEGNAQSTTEEAGTTVVDPNAGTGVADAVAAAADPKPADPAAVDTAPVEETTVTNPLPEPAAPAVVDAPVSVDQPSDGADVAPAPIVPDHVGAFAKFIAMGERMSIKLKLDILEDLDEALEDLKDRAAELETNISAEIGEIKAAHNIA